MFAVVGDGRVMVPRGLEANMFGVVRGCLLLSAFTAGCASAPAPLRVVMSPAWSRPVPVRVPTRAPGVPIPVERATVHALRDAGLTVRTTDPRHGDELVLILDARCHRGWLWRWHCAAYTVRLVDRATAQVYASAVLPPRSAASVRLAAIQAALRTGLTPPARAVLTP